MLPGFLSPAMAPVVVPIIGAAVIGVRPISVTVIGRPVVTGSVVVVVITIARTVIAVRARRAGGECAGSQAESQSGADAPSPRLSRRRHGGGANCGNRRQNRQCFPHAHLLTLSTPEITQGFFNGFSGNRVPQRKLQGLYSPRSSPSSFLDGRCRETCGVLYSPKYSRMILLSSSFQCDLLSNSRSSV